MFCATIDLSRNSLCYFNIEEEFPTYEERLKELRELVASGGFLLNRPSPPTDADLMHRIEYEEGILSNDMRALQSFLRSQTGISLMHIIDFLNKEFKTSFSHDTSNPYYVYSCEDERTFKEGIEYFKKNEVPVINIGKVFHFY